MPLNKIQQQMLEQQVQDRLNKVDEHTTQLAEIAYNVKTFGAKGDGITDDTAAIQSAINSIPTGSKLLFPKGNYLCNNYILINKAISLVSNGATITHTTNNILIVLDTTTVGDIVIDGITFDGANKNAAIGTYQNATSTRTTNVYIKNCTFLNAGNPALGNTGGYLGFNIQYANRAIVENCLFDTIEYFGVSLSNSAYCAVLNSTFINCGFYGMTCNESDYCLYDNNYLYNCGYGGFDAEITDYVNKQCKIIWTNNTIENCGDATGAYGGGMVAGNGCYGLIQQNLIKDFNMVRKTTSIRAITTARNTELTIDNNMILNCGQEAVYVSNSDPTKYRFKVTNNYIKNAQGIAISIYNSLNTLIMGNKISECQLEGMYLNLCTYSLVVGNTVNDNSKIGANTRSGIKTRGSSQGVFSGNNIIGAHLYALELTDENEASLNTIKANNWNGATKFTNRDGGVLTELESIHGKKIGYGSNAPTTGYWTASDIIYNNTPVASGSIGWVCITAGYANNTAWATGASYTVGQRVNTNNKVYECITAGTSGATAPTATGADITDGTVHWKYVGILAVFKTFGNISA